MSGYVFVNDTNPAGLSGLDAFFQDLDCYRTRLNASNIPSGFGVVFGYNAPWRVLGYEVPNSLLLVGTRMTGAIDRLTVAKEIAGGSRQGQSSCSNSPPPAVDYYVKALGLPVGQLAQGDLDFNSAPWVGVLQLAGKGRVVFNGPAYLDAGMSFQNDTEKNLVLHMDHPNLKVKWDLTHFPGSGDTGVFDSQPPDYFYCDGRLPDDLHFQWDNVGFGHSTVVGGDCQTLMIRTVLDWTWGFRMALYMSNPALGTNPIYRAGYFIPNILGAIPQAEIYCAGQWWAIPDVIWTGI